MNGFQRLTDFIGQPPLRWKADTRSDQTKLPGVIRFEQQEIRLPRPAKRKAILERLIGNRDALPRVLPSAEDQWKLVFAGSARRQTFLIQ